jgi:Protein of unknown function (DUF1524)
MSFYNKFNSTKLLEFLKLLGNKFSADWILRFTPTDRINNMNEILKRIEKVTTKNIDNLLTDSKLWEIDLKKLKEAFEDDIYGKRFAKYLLLQLEYFAINQQTQFNNFNIISIEHILPQNPDSKSKWFKKFSKDEHESYLNKLGNLVLISRKKNSQLSNSDFEDKKKKYFNKFIDTFHNSLKIIQEKDWDTLTYQSRQKDLVKKLINYYKS